MSASFFASMGTRLNERILLRTAGQMPILCWSFVIVRAVGQLPQSSRKLFRKRKGFCNHDNKTDILIMTRHPCHGRECTTVTPQHSAAPPESPAMRTPSCPPIKAQIAWEHTHFGTLRGLKTPKMCTFSCSPHQSPDRLGVRVLGLSRAVFVSPSGSFLSACPACGTSTG